MPVTMRMAANAPQVIAAAISLNPAIRLGVAAVGIASWILSAKLVYDAVNGTWVKQVTDGGVDYEYWPGGSCPWSSLAAAAQCGAQAWALTNGPFSVSSVSPNAEALNYTFTYCLGSNCQVSSPLGLYKREVPSSSTEDQPITPAQAAAELAAQPMPDSVPSELPPGVAVPVEDPVVNPSPSGEPQPLRVPQGDPVPIPNTNPQQWGSPAVDIVPSPTASDPWRVDVQPKTITSNTPDPLPDAQTVPTTPPDGQSEAPIPPDLCEKNPDILACQKFDTPDNPELENKEKSLSLTPTSGWGAESAACPSPRHLQFVNVDFSFQGVCDFMAGIRPIVIAVAWLAAAFILLGARTET